MAERRRGISIRLGVQDAEVVKRALESLGRDGQAALRRIEEGAKGPTSSLRALNAVSGEVQSTMAATASRLGPAGVALSSLGPAGMAAGAGLAAVFAALSGGLTVARELETLQAALETATGSASAAERAFADIKDFAVTTPFGLQEVTTAFIKLKNLGLDPSREALESYGNTASAMGKSLDQFIEAVADASTGEFERLKEFGIVARTEGNNVTLTFRGVSTTVQKEASAIEGYLRRLGQVEFAGGMERQAKTLDSVIGNLRDEWGLLLAEFADTTGATTGAKWFLQNLTQMASDLRGALQGVTTEARFAKAFDAARKLEGEIAELRSRGVGDDDPSITSRIAALNKLQVIQEKLQSDILTQADGITADATARKADADKKAAAAAEARAAAIKGVTDSQRRELELARMAADQRAEATAADKAEADLRKAASDATADEIAAARARAVEVVRAERATADAARAAADAQKEKEQATKKAASEMKRAREEAERAAAADAKAIRALRDELALLNASTPAARQQLERDLAVRDARESISQPGRRDEAGQLAGDVFDAEQRERMREAGRQVFDETRTAAEQYAARLADLNKLVQAGAIDYETYTRATAAAKEEMRRAETGAGDLSTALLGGLGHALTSLRGDFKNFGEVALSVLQHVTLELIRMQEAARSAGKSGPLSGIFDAIGGIVGGLFGGGGGGFDGSLVADAAAAGIPGGGFAHGGSFRVGGMGGVDSQVVAFRATPGERVDIRTPATASAMGSGGSGGPSYYIDARGASDPAAVEAAVDRVMSRRLPAAMKVTETRAVARVRDQFSRANWYRGM